MRVGLNAPKEVDLSELWPVSGTEIDYGLVTVGVPRQEVRGSFVPSRSNNQINISNRLVVESGFDQVSIDIGVFEVASIDGVNDTLYGTEQLRPAAVGERDVEDALAVLLCSALCVPIASCTRAGSWWVSPIARIWTSRSCTSSASANSRSFDSMRSNRAFRSLGAV